MANIKEEKITITFSKIVKAGAEDSQSMITDELLATIETVAQELVGDHIVVEIEG